MSKDSGGSTRTCSDVRDLLFLVCVSGSWRCFFLTKCFLPSVALAIHENHHAMISERNQSW